MRTRHHVVLATYGEPPDPRFADQLVYSWRILLGLTRKVAAIPKPVLPLIALARAHGRRQLWREHGYGSPLEPITHEQADGLASRLTAALPHAEWHVHVGYEYRTPLVGDLVASLPADEPVWVLPLYAAESAFTHDLTRDAVAQRHPQVHVLGALPADVLGGLSAAHVREQTDTDRWHGRDVALVLAAHGTVLDPPRPIDTGLDATEALCANISARLAGRFGLIVNGWLNHTRGGRWTEPAVDAALAEVERAGFRRVVYFPFGFLGDNAESQLEGRVALARTSLDALHLPCLNASGALLETLTARILAAIDGEAAAVAPARPAADGVLAARMPHHFDALPTS
jgi:protoheme ferro-lyase